MSTDLPVRIFRTVVLVLATALFGYFIIDTSYFLTGNQNHIEKDFTVFFTAGQTARTSPKELYSQDARLVSREDINNGRIIYINPPQVALIMSLFAHKDFKKVAVVFSVLNIVLILIALRIGNFITNRTPGWLYLLPFSYLPVIWCLILGQLSIIILTIFCLALFLIKKNRPFLAGCALHLLIIKFQFLPLIVPAILSSRHPNKVLAGFLSSSIASVLLILGVFGNFLPNFLQLLSITNSGSHDTQLSIFPTLVSITGISSITLAPILGIVCILTSTVLVFKVRKKARFDFTMASFVIFLLVFNPHVLIHDYVLVLIPIYLLLSEGFKEHKVGFLLAAFTLFIAPFLMIIVAYYNHHLRLLLLALELLVSIYIFKKSLAHSDRPFPAEIVES